MATPIANAGSDIVVAQADVASTKSVVIPAATGTDSAGGTTVSSFAWTIVSKPSGSSASLASATSASPTLNSIDTWGNYLLLCQVTDSYGESSAASYSTAPSSALLAVRVQSTTLGLEQLASGERAWSDKYNKAVAAIVSSATSAASPTVAALTDTVATGTELNLLVGGGSTTLHTHSGLTIDASTTLVRGSIQLAEAPLAASSPKAVTQARGSFSGRRVITGGTPGSGSIAVSSAAANGVTGATPDLITITLPWDLPAPSTGRMRLVAGTGYPTVSTSSDFDWVGGAGTDAVQATNIAGAINNAFNGIIASASGSTVTIKATRGGADNNSISVAYTASGSSMMTVTAFASGSDNLDTTEPIMAWRAEEDVTLTSWAVAVSTAPYATDLKFQLHKVSATEFAAKSWTVSNKVAELNCKQGTLSDDGDPKSVSGSLDPVVSISAGEMLVIRPSAGTTTKQIEVWAQAFWRRRF